MFDCPETQKPPEDQSANHLIHPYTHLLFENHRKECNLVSRTMFDCRSNYTRCRYHRQQSGDDGQREAEIY